jgi:hypothetical protein
VISFNVVEAGMLNRNSPHVRGGAPQDKGTGPARALPLLNITTLISYLIVVLSLHVFFATVFFVSSLS